MHRTSTTVVCSLVALLGTLTALVWAGPLTPPPGPVSSTYKTLNEIEPRIAVNAANTPGDADSLFKITQRGSYYLTGNISGVANKHGIEIAVSGVTLDLNGFDVSGIPGSFDGITTSGAGLSNIAVLNGSVRTWGDDGVDLAVPRCKVTDVRAEDNGDDGIYTGNMSIVSGCIVSGNVGTGIDTALSSTVSRCTAYNNSGDGIAADGVVSQCTAYSNSGYGVYISNGGAIADCMAYLNFDNGISTGNGCTIARCTADSNMSNNGIATGGHCTVSHCSARFNEFNGILTQDGCTVIGCASSYNDDNGITVGTGSTVTDCAARSNATNGIRCSSQCLARGNSCSNNGTGAAGGAGIHAWLEDNRVEGNTCTGADRGIEVGGTGNIIIKNTCSGNTTNWDIAANNIFGPIEDLTAPASAAVLGNAAAGTLSSSHPNANFTH